MIYVLDNGCSYSDHAIYFIDVPDDVDAALRKDIVAFMEVDEYETPQVIAIAKQFEWLHPDGQSFSEWFKWHSYRKQTEQANELRAALRAALDAMGYFS